MLAAASTTAAAGDSGGIDTPATNHWSLRPLRPPAVPQTRQATGHPIDAFIRARLEAAGLTPSPEADRRTLLRRLTQDLVGLPPTPEEVAEFEGDAGTGAYERWVERRLQSPAHGERWARHWLDTIHFADSHGYEHDIGRDNAWRFRDYVIEAFNADTPWARFVREQLAADVFYPDEPRLTAALGYLGAGTFDMSTFGTAPVTFDYLDRDDLVTQTMAAFASTTANCARCHNHKFDPIPQEDYYALQAVFAGVLKGDVSYDADPAVARERRRWRDALEAAERRDAAVLLAAEHEPAVRAWLVAQGKGVAWTRLEPETFQSSDGATLTLTNGGVLFSGGRRPDKDTYVVTAAAPLATIAALRLDVVAHDALPMRGPGRQDNGNLHLSEIELRVFEPGAVEGRLVRFARAAADFNQEGWGIERALDGDLKTAWGIHPAVGRSHQAVFECVEPVRLSPGARLGVVLKQAHGGGHLIGAFTLAVTTETGASARVRSEAVEAALAVPENARTEAQRVELAAQAVRVAAQAALEHLPPPAIVYGAAAAVDILSGDPPKQARMLKEPKTVHVLHRGDFDKPRAVARPGALSVLGALQLPARFEVEPGRGEGARRAALADWLVHANNVLTWRSVVNRVWHHHFGRGLCDTPSDFGRMGGTPSHPELLDWLAVWFRDEARGSLKALHRLIVTSETYRQSSALRPEGARVDADNRLLWRQNRQRLDADAYRDAALAVSGALDRRMGGPGVRHFKQSPGPQLTPALDYRVYDWSQAGAGRRSIYRFVWRGIPDPFMEALDFPDLGLLAPARGFSVSSLQALALFNNDFVLHHSRRMAVRVAAETAGGSEAECVERAVRLVWLRAPEAGERAEFAVFVRRHGLAALCRLLLNSNEFLFVN